MEESVIEVGPNTPIYERGIAYRKLNVFNLRIWLEDELHGIYPNMSEDLNLNGILEEEITGYYLGYIPDNIQVTLLEELLSQFYIGRDIVEYIKRAFRKECVRELKALTDIYRKSAFNQILFVSTDEIYIGFDINDNKYRLRNT